MSRRSTDVSLLIGALLLSVATTSGANLIAYNIGTPNHNRVMVMDDTGANATQIFEGGKFSGALRLTVSPPGVDGTWVAFEDYDLYKVRTDGTDLTKMLCFQGTDSTGELFNLFGNPQWSPDGSEILVSVLGEQGRELALLPADSEVYSDATGEDCTSLELVLIPYFAETRDDQWGLEGTAAWNDDGSQIAFFETGPNSDWRLAILEQKNGDWVLQEGTYLYPDPDFPEIYPTALDWQRGGSVLAFVVRVGAEARSDIWLTWIDVEDGKWDFFTDNGNPIEATWDPTWSPESPSQHLIFTDSRGNLVKWTYPNGPGEVLGSGKGADWQRDALDCNITGCDDGNPCTVGTCEQTGKCTYQPASAGIPCNDGDVCTQTDHCDAAGQCIGSDPATDGTSCDFDSGICCTGTCSTNLCEDAADCFDGDICTTDSCIGGNTCAASCKNDPIQGCPSCDAKGANCTLNSDCCSGQCHPRKGTCK